ncbi:hypothetical protein DR88_5255 [Klebsiella pneumoniae]|nr:hypothetical protein DR88_5255 [Klebsiella pneumoniae]
MISRWKWILKQTFKKLWFRVSTTGKKWVFRNLGGRKSMKLFS